MSAVADPVFPWIHRRWGNCRRDRRGLYIPEEATVIYKSKDGKEEKVFDTL
jgi:hypothetical protein